MFCTCTYMYVIHVTVFVKKNKKQSSYLFTFKLNTHMYIFKANLAVLILITNQPPLLSFFSYNRDKQACQNLNII